MRKAIAAKLKAGKLSQVDSESHMNIEHFRTSQDFSQVDSNIEYSEDGQIAIMEERSPRRYTMAQTKEIQCKESMGWRNVAQTDVKSFVAQSPTKVYTDTVFTKAIATENAAA